MKLRMIGMEQLKVDTSTVLDAVEQGNACVVTRRGKAAAVLLPVRYAEELILTRPEIVRGLFDTPDDQTVEALAIPAARKKAS